MESYNGVGEIPPCLLKKASRRFLRFDSRFLIVRLAEREFIDAEMSSSIGSYPFNLLARSAAAALRPSVLIRLH